MYANKKIKEEAKRLVSNFNTVAYSEAVLFSQFHSTHSIKDCLNILKETIKEYIKEVREEKTAIRKDIRNGCKYENEECTYQQFKESRNIDLENLDNKLYLLKNNLKDCN